MFKRFLTAVMLTMLPGLALAQVNVVPQIGLNTQNVRQQTFSAVSIALVPAASATDILCISPGATKSIYLKNITISGTAGTAVTTPVVLLRRNTALDSGGTAATGTALPVAGAMYSSNAASTATLTAYTANPTINDSSPTYLRAAVLGIPLSSAAIAQTLNMSFGTNVEEYDQEGLLLKNTTQQACINLNAVSISSGSLTTWLEWTEQ